MTSRDMDEPAAAAPSAKEAASMRTLLARLQTEEGLKSMPTPVADTIQSLTGDVTRIIEGGPESRYSKATIRIRTRFVHWNPALMIDGAGQRASSRTVGWYAWQWETTTTTKRAGRTLSIVADNLMMLDPAYLAANEPSPIGRYMDDALLYHELLHGQLLINAMDDPAWQKRLMDTGTFDSTESDASHQFISGYERDFLLHRSGALAFSVAPGADAQGGFTLVAGRLRSGYRGEVSMEFRSTASGNVRDLQLDLPEDGPYHGEVLIRGRLADPKQAGFFLAAITPTVSPAVAPVDTAQEVAKIPPTEVGG